MKKLRHVLKTYTFVFLIHKLHEAHIYYNFFVLLYTVDTEYEIQGSFLLLKNHIFIVCIEDTIFIFYI